MELRAGSHVTPNVRLVRLLGTGGMGSVWVADHLGLATQVAVKFVSKVLLEQDKTIVARFNREAALSAQIRSPHAVQIHDHGVTDDGTPFIVMELLEGESLSERVERKGTLTLSDCGQLVTQTAKALARAHRLGIVHRDIKPDNLFLVESEFELFVKVLDFGIAKQRQMAGVAPVTTTGAMVGTPEFMSPEQVLSAKDVDHRSDLWALGVVAYYALTVRVPFGGETLGSLCVAIAAGKFTPPSALRPGVPKTIDGWFAQALAVDPKDRFQSAREMAVAYAEALGHAGRSIEDQFSQMGSLRPPPPAEGSGEGAARGGGPGEECWWAAPDGELVHPSGPPPSSEPAPSEPPAPGPAKGTPTFSGASLATTPKRKVKRAAIGGLVAVGVVCVAVAAALGVGGGTGVDPLADKPSDPTVGPREPGLASAAAAPTENTATTDAASRTDTAANSADAEGSDAPGQSSTASASSPKPRGPQTGHATKAVAAGSNAQPESSASAAAAPSTSAPLPEPSATSNATSEPSSAPKDRGF